MLNGSPPNRLCQRAAPTGRVRDWWLWSTYQVTVTVSPTVQTVVLSGEMTGGDQTSLFDKCKLDRPGAGVAETPSAKKRSAALAAGMNLRGDIIVVITKRRVGERKMDGNDGTNS
jgi:hypothetical protein